MTKARIHSKTITFQTKKRKKNGKKLCQYMVSIRPSRLEVPHTVKFKRSSDMYVRINFL